MNARRSNNDPNQLTWTHGGLGGGSRSNRLLLALFWRESVSRDAFPASFISVNLREHDAITD